MSIVFIDDFNRGNLGANWAGGYTDDAGVADTPTIVSNRLQAATLNIDAWASYVNAIAADQWAQVTIPTMTGAAITGCRVTLRMNAPGSITSYECFAGINLSPKTWIGYWNAAVLTQVVTEDVTAWTGGDILYGDIKGRDIRLFRNGNLLLQCAHGGITGSGRVGVGLYVASGSLANLELDDFKAGNFVNDTPSTAWWSA